MDALWTAVSVKSKHFTINYNVYLKAVRMVHAFV